MMDNVSSSGFALAADGLMPCEEMLEVMNKRKKMQIALPRESFSDENRVALAPHAVGFLVNQGHDVIIEKGAGERAHFDDAKYVAEGARISTNRAELYSSEVIVKVLPPTFEELAMMPGKQVLFSSYDIHSQDCRYIQMLLEKKITAISFEYYKDKRADEYPIAQSISEISGSTAVMIAAEYLSNEHGGKGEMLGGVSGISPTEVVILGAGTAGESAARTAMGLGATVKVFDLSITKLRAMQEHLGQRFFTSVLQQRVLLKALRTADVVIGALYENNDRQRDFIVMEDAVSQMKPRSVIVDLCMNQGGCFETSQRTSFANPVYYTSGVAHYCVPNIPSRVARTASYAVSNVLGQLLVELGEAGGINQLVRQHYGVRCGTYVYNGILVKECVASHFGIPFQDINLIMAAF